MRSITSIRLAFLADVLGVTRILLERRTGDMSMSTPCSKMWFLLLWGDWSGWNRVFRVIVVYIYTYIYTQHNLYTYLHRYNYVFLRTIRLDIRRSAAGRAYRQWENKLEDILAMHHSFPH